MTIINPLANSNFETIGYMIGILPYLLGGAWISIKLASVGLFGGVILGIPLAFLKTYGKGVARWIASAYIEFFRGTPLLLQLFIVYFGLPEIGISFDRTVAVWIALSLNSGAYQAEYFRGALNAIDQGQLQSAKALGMSFAKRIRYVILPQLIRIVLPSWSNEVIYIVKYAAIAFTVAIPDLLARGKMLTSWHYKPVEVFIMVALIYIILLSLIGSIMNRVEKKVRIPGLLLDKGRDA